MSIVPNFLFIKELLTVKIPDVASEDSWAKMKEECFPDNNAYVRDFCPKTEDGAWESGIYEDLNFLNSIIDESLEFYLHGDRSSAHKFSWESD